MPDTEAPESAAPDSNKDAQPTTETKAAEREALKEQQKRELPSNDWPGKGAA